MKTATRFLRTGLICVIASSTFACSDPQTTRDRHFARGNELAAKADHAGAIVEYRKAVNVAPMYAPARQKLAESLERTGDLANAAREFIRVADLLPSDAAAQVRAGRYLLGFAQFPDAVARARKAVEIDPRYVDGHILLGTAIARTNDLDAAVKQIQEAIDIDPLLGSSHLNMGALLLAKGERAEAKASIERAVRLDPKSMPARLALVNYHLRVGELPEAEKAIKDALSVNPADLQANRVMAVLLMSTQRAAEAEPYVKAAVVAAATPAAELMLADYYLRVNRTDDAKAILERLSSDEQVLVPASIRLARLDYAAGRKAEAHARLDGVMARMPSDAESRVIKSQWLLGEEQITEAKTMAEMAVKADARLASAHFALGRARMASRDRSGAEESFNEVLRLNPRAAAAQTALARLNLSAGKTEQGVQFARDAIKNQPRHVDPRMVLIRGLLAQRDVERAASELAVLTRALPDDPGVQALNGALLLLRQDKAGARAAYERALAADPGQIDALAGITGLDIEARQMERARQRLTAQLQKDANNPRVLLLSARLNLAAGDLAAGEQQLRQVIALDPSVSPAYDLLARTYGQQNRLEEARKEFEGIAEREPSVSSHTMVGLIFYAQNRLDDAEKAYRRALDAGPAAPLAANNLAYLWAARDHNLEEALALARAAAVHLKDDPAVLDTVGWVYYKKNQADLAIPQFEASIRLNPRNPIYHYHLGLAYVKAGEQDKARRALQEALRLNASFEGADEARRTLASLST